MHSSYPFHTRLKGKWNQIDIFNFHSHFFLSEEKEFLQEASGHNICIGSHEQIAAYSSKRTLLQTAYETTNQNVVVLFLDDGDIPFFMNAVGMQNSSKRITWVFAFNQKILDQHSGDEKLVGAFFINSFSMYLYFSPNSILIYSYADFNCS